LRTTRWKNPRGLDQLGVRVLLQEERAAVVLRVLRVERGLRVRALEVGDDARRIGQRVVAILEARDLPERADLHVLGRLPERDLRLELVGDVLLGQGHAHLAHERGSVDSMDDDGHGILLIC
jgi:hypothetical protein